MKNNLRSFSDNIYAYRKSINKSQTQFADLIAKEMQKQKINFNYTNKSISKWEAGDSLPSLEVLIVLSKLMNVKIDELLKDKIEEFKTIKENVTTNAIQERFKKIPDVYCDLFGDGQDYTFKYGILGQMAKSISDYYDEDYITDESIINDIIINCPIAVADYDQEGIKKLEYLITAHDSKIDECDNYVKDEDNRNFVLSLNKKRTQRYTFKNYNLQRFMFFGMPGDEEKISKDLGINNFENFKIAFDLKIKEIIEYGKQYKDSGLLEKIGIDFGFDVENKKILFYLTGTLKLSIEELKEIWGKIAATDFYNMLKSDIAKKTAKEYLKEVFD